MKTYAKTSLFATLALVLSLPLSAQDDLELGKMWTFDHAPSEYFQTVHGFDLTQGWLDAVRLSTLRYGGGCSSSFVSPDGLIMTNHHCARGDIAKACPPGEDWVRDGYVAQTMNDEVKLSGLAVRQLIRSAEVTAAMNAGIAEGDSEAAIATKRRNNQTAILAEAAKAHPALEAQVTALYQGGMYQLYQYRVFSDLRLVAAPHLQTAHFGGDPDNFTYPRWGIDFTFVRAYVDDKPFDSSQHYFKFNPAGPQKGDSVFIPGNPGRTERLLTRAELEFKRDFALPTIRERIAIAIAPLEAQIKSQPKFEAQLRPQILRLENAKKAYMGYHNALLDESLINKKIAAERLFRAKIDSDPKLKAKFGDVWDKISALNDQQKALWPILRAHGTFKPRILGAAADVLTMHDPKASAAAKKDAHHKLFGNNDMPEAIAQAGAPRRLRLAMQLRHARKWAPKNDALMATVFPDLDEEKAVATFLDTSVFSDPMKLKALLDGGSEAVAKSQDPALRMARVLKQIDPQKSQAKFTTINVALGVQKTRLGQAIFAVYGTTVSPDATGTLRISDGIVKGYPMNGTLAPWKTTFHGLYDRNIAFANEYPFNLPQPWLDHKDKVDMSQALNFCSTNDIIGGNSGSAVINSNREIVGLVFDGNIEMLANQYLYRSDIPRAVSVHSAAIIEALSKIYAADRVVKELLRKE